MHFGKSYVCASQVSWMFKKQTSVSHSSTESEIIALDAGLRLDGKPALDFWDLIVSVFGSVSQISDRTGRLVESTWIDIEPGAQFDQAYPVAKRLYTLLRHGELSRKEDKAIEFWRLKDDLRNKFEHSQHRSDDVWKNKMAGGGQKFFTFELFKVIQDAIQLILHFRIMS